MSSTQPSTGRKTVMVSVVSYRLLVDYVRSLGFTQDAAIDMSNVALEITGGYSSYLRGDKFSRGSCPSVFPGRLYEISPDTILRKGSIYFGIHTHKHSNQMLGDCEIAHFVGPEDQLFELLLQIIGDSWPDLHLGSFSGDLEIALLWWKGDERCIRDCTESGDSCK